MLTSLQRFIFYKEMKKMNELKKITFITFLTILFSIILPLHLMAQKVEGGSVAGKTAPRMPAAYRTPTGDILNAKAERNKSGDPIWIVYSDREDNKIYYDKNCTQEMGALNFLEACVVADESDDALRLVAYDGADLPYTDKNGKAVFKNTAYDKGWIKKKYLLLWENCLIDRVTKYSIKAISVKKLPDNGDYSSLLKNGVLDIYNSPKINKAGLLNKDVKLFQYFFVLKEDKESGTYLLSKNIHIYSGSATTDILGWVSINQIHLWNNAMCLRTNLDPKAILERKEKNIDVKFFKTFDDAKKFSNEGSAANNLLFLYSDPTDENIKDNPYFYGFPIIDSTKDRNIYKTGYITDTKSKNNKTVFKARDQAGYNEIYESAARQKLKINVVFVMDGSTNDHIKATARAIMDNPIIGNTERSRADYRLGAIIYNNPSCGSEPFKRISLTANKESFVSMLSNEGSKSPCPINTKSGSALFEALEKASAMFNDNKTTNVIIIAGSASDINKAQRESVLLSLIKKQVMMHYYQVTNAGGNIYDDFIRDAKYLLENTSNSIDENNLSYHISKNAVQKAKLESIGDDFILTNSALPGALYTKDKGQSFSTAEINKRLKRLFTEINDKVLSYLSLYDETTVGARSISESSDEDKKRLLLMFKGLGIPDNVCSKLVNENNFQLFILAYAPLKTPKLKEQLLIRNLFLSNREYQRLIESFNKLRDVSSEGSRTGLINAYKDIITSYKGGNVDAKKLDKFTSNDFLKLITSLPPNNNPLFKKTINDLNDYKKTSDEEIDKLKKVFINMGLDLKRISSNPLNKIEQDDETFYWVPEKIFQIPSNLIAD